VILSWKLIWKILTDLYHRWLTIRAAFDKIKSSCFRKLPQSQLGAPDLIVFRRIIVPSDPMEQNYQCDVLCIEAKSATGKQSKEQKRWQKMAEAQGMKYIIARSLEDVMEALR
jgi:hypothetical protein